MTEIPESLASYLNSMVNVYGCQLMEYWISFWFYFLTAKRNKLVIPTTGVGSRKRRIAREASISHSSHLILSARVCVSGSPVRQNQLPFSWSKLLLCILLIIACLHWIVFLLLVLINVPVYCSSNSTVVIVLKPCYDNHSVISFIYIYFTLV